MMAYDKAWEYQTQIHQRLIQQKRLDAQNFKQLHTLLLCEHPHVYTLGKSGKEEHLVIPEDKLDTIQATFYRINRGGDITYHGPGQLVAYPILDLEKLFTDVHQYVRFLEEAIIRVLREYNIEASRIDGLTGVWLDIDAPKPRKICAIGVHLSRWVSLHGLAFNVNSDLNYYNHIIPCGISQTDKSVTSLQV
ncbi:MAG: lipoyl(octanoyl) transferase LipB, partial [Saprospiraceae bacterium]|nr:lipoyl(octanoyl) transferase LipB [Saprospiraceae bacterium]